jgi:hypothetical protein
MNLVTPSPPELVLPTTLAHIQNAIINAINDRTLAAIYLLKPIAPTQFFDFSVNESTNIIFYRPDPYASYIRNEAMLIINPHDSAQFSTLYEYIQRKIYLDDDYDLDEEEAPNFHIFNRN